VLRDGGEALVQQELEAVVVRTHTERPTPKIRSPVAHRLDQPDKLALICRELVMASGEGAAEEGQRSLTLVEDGVKADARGVAVHHEWHDEIRHLEDGSRREHPLESHECHSRLLVPGEGVASKEAR
jgi:hypothetical protein